MKQIWLVMGETGEYDDYTEWIVCAYENQEDAMAHAKAADDWWKANFHRRSDWMAGDRAVNPYDPDGTWPDYNGSRYRAFAVEVIEKFAPVA